MVRERQMESCFVAQHSLRGSLDRVRAFCSTLMGSLVIKSEIISTLHKQTGSTCVCWLSMCRWMVGLEHMSPLQSCHRKGATDARGGMLMQWNFDRRTEPAGVEIPALHLNLESELRMWRRLFFFSLAKGGIHSRGSSSSPCACISPFSFVRPL